MISCFGCLTLCRRSDDRQRQRLQALKELEDIQGNFPAAEPHTLQTAPKAEVDGSQPVSVTPSCVADDNGVVKVNSGDKTENAVTKEVGRFLEVFVHGNDHEPDSVFLQALSKDAEPIDAELQVAGVGEHVTEQTGEAAASAVCELPPEATSPTIVDQPALSLAEADVLVYAKSVAEPVLLATPPGALPDNSTNTNHAAKVEDALNTAAALVTAIVAGDGLLGSSALTPVSIARPEQPLCTIADAQQLTPLAVYGMGPPAPSTRACLPEGRQTDVTAEDVPGFTTPRQGLQAEDVPGFTTPRQGLQAEDALVASPQGSRVDSGVRSYSSPGSTPEAQTHRGERVAPSTPPGHKALPPDPPEATPPTAPEAIPSTAHKASAATAPSATPGPPPAPVPGHVSIAIDVGRSPRGAAGSSPSRIATAPAQGAYSACTAAASGPISSLDAVSECTAAGSGSGGGGSSGCSAAEPASASACASASSAATSVAMTPTSVVVTPTSKSSAVATLGGCTGHGWSTGTGRPPLSNQASRRSAWGQGLGPPRSPVGVSTPCTSEAASAAKQRSPVLNRQAGNAAVSPGSRVGVQAGAVRKSVALTPRGGGGTTPTTAVPSPRRNGGTASGQAGPRQSPRSAGGDYVYGSSGGYGAMYRGSRFVPLYGSGGVSIGGGRRTPPPPGAFSSASTRLALHDVLSRRSNRSKGGAGGSGAGIDLLADVDFRPRWRY